VTKAERFLLFLSQLSPVPSVDSGDAALGLITSTLNRVEDEWSGSPFAPTRWQDDGRLYPPDPDYARPVNESLTEYRHVAQHVHPI
jgi:hypothetical protein